MGVFGCLSKSDFVMLLWWNGCQTDSLGVWVFVRKCDQRCYNALIFCGFVSLQSSGRNCEFRQRRIAFDRKLGVAHRDVCAKSTPSIRFPISFSDMGQKNETDTKLKWAARQKEVGREMPAVETSLGPRWCLYAIHTIHKIIPTGMRWTENAKMLAWFKTSVAPWMFQLWSSILTVSCRAAHLSLDLPLPCRNMIWQNRWTGWISCKHHGWSHLASCPRQSASFSASIQASSKGLFGSSPQIAVTFLSIPTWN